MGYKVAGALGVIRGRLAKLGRPSITNWFDSGVFVLSNHDTFLNALLCIRLRGAYGRLYA